MAEDSASITINGADGTDDDLRALATWLRDENELRGHVKLDSAPIGHEEMGAALDAVVVLLSSATAGTLIRSVKDWLIATRNAKKVTLKLTAKDGRELELSCGSAEDADAAMEAARKFLGQ